MFDLNEYFLLVKDKLADMSAEEVQHLIDSPEVVLSNKRVPTKFGQSIHRIQNDFSIKISQDLKSSSMEGIIAVWENDLGVLESKMLVSADGKAPEPALVGYGT